MINTRGINSERDLSNFLHRDNPSDVSDQTMHEVFMKNMITSCFAYGDAEKDSPYFTQYIEK